MPDGKAARTLSERFLVAGGHPLFVEGREVRLSLEIPVEEKLLTGVLRFVSRRSSPRQGVMLDVKGGRLEVAGQSARRMILWADTSPVSVDLTLVRTARKQPAILRLWNSWRYGDDGDPQSWLDNAGLRYEERSPRTFLVECSDGWGEVDFRDLVVELAWHDDVRGGPEPTSTPRPETHEAHGQRGGRSLPGGRPTSTRACEGTT